MSIFSQVTGHGPTILLTHGFAATSRMFINTISAIATNHTVVVWDQLGHGRSDSPDDPEHYSVAASLEAMRGLVELAGGGPAILLGHSLGGYLSLEFALTHPDDVRALVLVDTGPGYRSDRGRAQWNEMAERYAAGLDADGLESLSGSPELSGARHPGAAGLAHTARRVLPQVDGHVIEALPSIAVPTLVVVGELDEAFLPGSRYMAEKIPGAELAVIAGAGHAPPLTHPAEFNAVLRAFLALDAAGEGAGAPAVPTRASGSERRGPVPDLDAAALATRFIDALERRQWEKFGHLLHPDVVYEVPQTRERIRGRQRYVQFNREYPGDWHLSPRVVLGDERRAVVWFTWLLGDEAPADGIAFFEVADGLITSITDFWPEPYEPPPGRAHLTERY